MNTLKNNLKLFLKTFHPKERKKIVDALHDESKSVHHSKIILNLLEFDLDRIKYNYIHFGKHSRKYLTNKYDLDGKYKWYFITLNYFPNVELEKVKIYMEKLVNSKFISKYLYNYEQRGESLKDLGKGLHNHILIGVDKLIYHNKTTPSKPSHIRKKMKLIKKNGKFLLGGLLDIRNTKNIFQIKSLLDGAEVVRKMDYLLGRKTESKMKKVDYDIIYRKNNNLKNYYIKNINL